MNAATEVAKAAYIIEMLVDEDPCRLDHSGNCQAHAAFGEGDCPHAAAKSWLARATASTTLDSGNEEVAAPVVQQPREAQKPASPQDRIDVEGLKAARERYARIISPNAWAFADKWASRPEMAAEIKYETGPSLRTADAILADHAELTAQRAALVEALQELVTVVRGECPSLLNEDSGGSHRLIEQIETALSKALGQDGESAS